MSTLYAVSCPHYLSTQVWSKMGRFSEQNTTRIDKTQLLSTLSTLFEQHPVKTHAHIYRGVPMCASVDITYVLLCFIYFLLCFVRYLVWTKVWTECGQRRF